MHIIDHNLWFDAIGETGFDFILQRLMNSLASK